CRPRKFAIAWAQLACPICGSRRTIVLWKLNRFQFWAAGKPISRRFPNWQSAILWDVNGGDFGPWFAELGVAANGGWGRESDFWQRSRPGGVRRRGGRSVRRWGSREWLARLAWARWGDGDGRQGGSGLSG